MKDTASIIGIGGKLAFYTILYVGFATVLTLYFPDIFFIRFAPRFSLLLLGGFFLAIGIPLLIVSVRQVTLLFKEGILITEGVFRYSRNPIYAAWAVFIIPGLSLLSSSWIFLGTPFVFYLVFKIFIREEEEYLSAHFGEEYLQYKAKVAQLFPRLKR
ncbi:MAG: isoprenylcysteine carboxylmethyltransferase family protein [Chloroflexi bacterium]|nr:isoprenylcysteine carboxylmethyltransferase family protein [Chloroflexota bacterium]